MTEPQKTPGIINWTGYLAITALAALPLSVLMVRAGVVQQGLLIYAISCLAATALLILCVILLLLPRFAPWRAAIRKRALATLPGAILLGMLVGGAGDYPAIHDITTDTDNPPEFSAAPDQRGPSSNPLEINPETLATQQQAYGDLSTLVTQLDIEAAFDRALEVAADMGWEVYHQDRDLGVIEAVDTTAIMAFKDDVVIRLRSNADGTLVDLRSVSRVGVGDLGANAKRIIAFQQRFADTPGAAR